MYERLDFRERWFNPRFRVLRNREGEGEGGGTSGFQGGNLKRGSVRYPSVLE